ncbi:MAG: ABC transporter [Bacillota bacterium]|nr:ABC transporter [Bacillota bacterium]
MFAIFKRDFCSLFNSIIGYIVFFVFLVFSGLFFYGTCLYQKNANVTYVFSNMCFIIAVLIPMLTMKTFSEGKNQILLTSPVSLIKVVLGKFFAVTIYYLICISIFFVYGIVIACFTTPDWATLFCNMLGLFLIGSALISAGVFISSLTNNSVIAAIGAIGAGLFLFFGYDFLINFIPNDSIKGSFSEASFMIHYNNFTIGILNLADTCFFISVCALFIFLTIRVFDKRRYS